MTEKHKNICFFIEEINLNELFYHHIDFILNEKSIVYWRLILYARELILNKITYMSWIFNKAFPFVRSISMYKSKYCLSSAVFL